jgi:hypothetical protein
MKIKRENPIITLLWKTIIQLFYLSYIQSNLKKVNKFTKKLTKTGKI